MSQTNINSPIQGNYLPTLGASLTSNLNACSDAKECCIVVDVFVDTLRAQNMPDAYIQQILKAVIKVVPLHSHQYYALLNRIPGGVPNP